MVEGGSKEKGLRSFEREAVGKFAKYSAMFWMLYSAYNGLRQFYEGKGRKKSKWWALLSFIFPIIILIALNWPSGSEEEEE